LFTDTLKEILRELRAIRVELQNIKKNLEPVESVPEDSDGKNSEGFPKVCI